MESIITCRVCGHIGPHHEVVEDMCQNCGDTDWYALSNGIGTYMPDGTYIPGDDELPTTEEK